MPQLSHFPLLVILLGMALLSGCAKRLEVQYLSSPPGASITFNSSNGDKSTLVTPTTLRYMDISDRGGCKNITMPSVTWPDGVSIPSQMMSLCSKEYTFYKPVRPSSQASKVNPPPIKNTPTTSDDAYFKNLDTERLCRVIQTGKPQDVEGARRELNTRSAGCQPANLVKEEVKPAPVAPYNPPPAVNTSTAPSNPPKPVPESPIEIKRKKCLRLGIAPGSLDFQQCMQ
jgi:hypothetical protein